MFKQIKCRQPKLRKDVSRTSIKGCTGELKVAIDLLKQGYHVALAVDPQCPFDLVAVDKEGKVKLIDVKSKSYRKKNNKKIYRCLKPVQKTLNVELMEIDND